MATPHNPDAKQGRPTKGGQAMTNAERQAAFKARRREEAARRERAEAEARRLAAEDRARVEDMKTKVRMWLGAVASARAFKGTLKAEGWATTREEAEEMADYFRQLGEALLRGDRRLP